MCEREWVLGLTRLSSRYVNVCLCVCVFVRSINSTIHAVMIVAGMLTTVLRQQWDDDLMPLGSTSAATALFSFCTCLFAPWVAFECVTGLERIASCVVRMLLPMVLLT